VRVKELNGGCASTFGRGSAPDALKKRACDRTACVWFLELLRHTAFSVSESRVTASWILIATRPTHILNEDAFDDMEVPRPPDLTIGASGGGWVAPRPQARQMSR
jgi:hypothetical protein